MDSPQHHRPGMLVVTVSGVNAVRISHAYMYSILARHAGLGVNGVVTLSWYETKTKWFVTLKQAAHITHYSSLHGKTFKLKEGKLTNYHPTPGHGTHQGNATLAAPDKDVYGQTPCRVLDEQ